MSSQALMRKRENFYLRYYCGHKGKFGHEFLEFELRPDRMLRYANNSQYKNDVMIRKQCIVSPLIVETIRERIRSSNIIDEDDSVWPNPDRLGKQELEIVMDDQHISFDCAKTISLADCEKSKDPQGMVTFYYLIQDIKCIVLSVIGMHFKIKPI